MASSSRLNLDLNLASPGQEIQRITGQASGNAAVWHPNFVSSRGPITEMDSVMRDNDVAAGVARNLLTPKDMRVLGKKDEHTAIEDVMALSVQCAVSIANLGQRLRVRNQEVQELTTQLGIQRCALRECHQLVKTQRDELNAERERTAREVQQLKQAIKDGDMVIKLLKDEKKADRISHSAVQRKMQKEKNDLARMVQMYSGEMQQKLDVVEGTNKRIREDEEKLFENAKRAVYARIFGETNVEVRGLKITEPRAEGQSSGPAEAAVETPRLSPNTIEDENPKFMEPILEGQSSKPSNTDDEVEGVRNLLSLSPLKGDKNV